MRLCNRLAIVRLAGAAVRMDRPWRSSDFNEWLALSRMAVQNLLGRAERVEGASMNVLQTQWGTIKDS